MQVFAAAWLLVLGMVDEPGFGGVTEEAPEAAANGYADDDPPPRVDEEPAATATPTADVDASVSRAGDFPGGGSSRSLEPFPESPIAESTDAPTSLEVELKRGGLDPSRHPLLALRVEVARARRAFEDGRQHGLYSLRDEEAAWRAAEAILVDVERIALHRMNTCLTRQGKNVAVKNYRMTAAGPVALSTQELLAHASPIDPDGCSRISLIDDAVIQRVRRAHALGHELSTRRFGYHEMAERRALEAEQATLRKELAREDLPILSLPGGQDPHRSR
jgi:hypothetical protein